MVKFYCPGCWNDFDQDVSSCPFCGLDIHEFWTSKDYVEKLILALHHPESRTPIRAAWLLGRTKDPRAVDPLIDVIKTTDDIYIAKAAVSALGEIDTAEARRFLGTLTEHPAKTIRDEAGRILGGRETSQGLPESPPEKKEMP
jgi:HEAT repeat protein